MQTSRRWEPDALHVPSGEAMKWPEGLSCLESALSLGGPPQEETAEMLETLALFPPHLTPQTVHQSWWGGRGSQLYLEVGVGKGLGVSPPSTPPSLCRNGFPQGLDATPSPGRRGGPGR